MLNNQIENTSIGPGTYNPIDLNGFHISLKGSNRAFSQNRSNYLSKKLNDSNYCKDGISYLSSIKEEGLGPGTYNPQLSQIYKNKKVIVKYPQQNYITERINKEKFTKLINELKSIKRKENKNDIDDETIFKLNSQSHFFKSKSRKDNNVTNGEINLPGPCSYDPNLANFLKLGYIELPSFSKSKKYINFINKDNSLLYQTKLDSIPSVGTYFRSKSSKMKELKKIKLSPEFKSKCNRDNISVVTSSVFPGPGAYSIQKQNYSVIEGNSYLI